MRLEYLSGWQLGLVRSVALIVKHLDMVVRYAVEHPIPDYRFSLADEQGVHS